MIFTFNEEIHISRCLASVSSFDDVIVVDSFSTDRTETICQRAKVRYYKHSFEGFGKQRNWALESTTPKHDWVLILDADERLSDALANEISQVVRSSDD